MRENEPKGFIRPKVDILEDKALIPEKNIIMPPPNLFTHETINNTPFFYSNWQNGKNPDGQFQSGTQVVLLVYNDDDYCRVVDNQGLYVEVEYRNLKKLNPSQ